MSADASDLFARACNLMPGGVNSPVRAFGGVGGQPPFIHRAAGALLEDTEGRQYIDYVGSWGPMIAGHAHPAVVQAVHEAAQKGLSFGAPHALEVLLAEKICQMMPAIERIRMVNSGTEAVMTALRLARGFTGRYKIIRFAGCYHGHMDALLTGAGSGVLTFGLPGSAGVPPAAVRDTLVADYNRPVTARALFEKYPADIAAVIVEPVAGNMNCILPVPGFLPALRELCDRYGALLILDEVMTGFRVAQGGAQALYGIRPDLVTLGKVIGGGLPVGACGGRADIMAHLAPLGAVYQAGTLSGNPLAMAAGLATLELVSAPGFYETLSATAARLMRGLETAAQARGVSLRTVACGGMFGFFLQQADRLPQTLSEVKKTDVQLHARFFHACLEQGVFLAPSAFEAGFVSSAHDASVIDKTLAVMEKALDVVKKALPQPAG